MLGGEHSGKVSKKFIGKFYFWGITLIIKSSYFSAGRLNVKLSTCFSWKSFTTSLFPREKDARLFLRIKKIQCFEELMKVVRGKIKCLRFIPDSELRVQYVRSMSTTKTPWLICGPIMTHLWTRYESDFRMAFRLQAESNNQTLCGGSTADWVTSRELREGNEESNYCSTFVPGQGPVSRKTR